jgi:hypothetical protein
MFCVYLTVYKGNELPPFYIGSTSINNIKNGYVGSPTSTQYNKLWKSISKQSPQLFKTKILKFFKNRADAYLYEKYLHQSLNVISNPLYCNKAIASKSFFEYQKHSTETKQKMSLASKGKPKSYEHRKNIAKALLGKKRPEEFCKRHSEYMKMAIQNGTRNQYIIGPRPGNLNGMFGRKHSEESKQKMRDSIKRRKEKSNE